MDAVMAKIKMKTKVTAFKSEGNLSGSLYRVGQNATRR